MDAAVEEADLEVEGGVPVEEDEADNDDVQNPEAVGIVGAHICPLGEVHHPVQLGQPVQPDDGESSVGEQDQVQGEHGDHVEDKVPTNEKQIFH